MKVSRPKRKEPELDRLHHLRLIAGAARFIAEKAGQEADRDARRLTANIAALLEIVEAGLVKVCGEE